MEAIQRTKNKGYARNINADSSYTSLEKLIKHLNDKIDSLQNEMKNLRF